MKKLIFCLLMSISFPQLGVTKEASDHYSYEKSEYFHDNVEIKIIEYKSFTSLRQGFMKLNPNSPLDTSVMAFSQINAHMNTCTIHMISPEVKYVPELVGHEFMHCIHGNWHHDRDQEDIRNQEHALNY